MRPPAAITVIVPGFDVAPYAPAALTSLRAQTRHDFIAVLVDDGSTDETGAMFDTVASEDNRFRVVHHDLRRGLSAARNTGLDLVTTPFVGFLDADDVLDPHALATLVGSLERTGSDLAVGAYVRLRPDDAGRYVSGEVQPWVAAATDPARQRATLESHPDVANNIVAWSKVTRAEMWRDLRFPAGKAYEDQVVAQLLYTRARAFDVVPDVVVQWRVRAEGTSITQRREALPVLRDYLEALAGGLAVLDASGATAAAASRVALMFSLDLPPLVQIARDHPDPRYRTLLGATVRALAPRTDVPLDVRPALSW
ncbi:glycosyltransferase family 2 protein [Microbacterium koreense]|uniref:Glycosyltransferase family 2 protein n=1 Tax=Microbacterium koreense TaxID=323761 RepID=A0ABW2ZSB1_9MICO